MDRRRLRLEIVKRFVHQSWQGVYAYHDTERDVWFVEERDAQDQRTRHRWYGLTERQAGEVCLSLIGDGEGWRDES
jgi:hypothetical protein